MSGKRFSPMACFFLLPHYLHSMYIHVRGVVNSAVYKEMYNSGCLDGFVDYDGRN